MYCLCVSYILFLFIYVILSRNKGFFVGVIFDIETYPSKIRFVTEGWAKETIVVKAQNKSLITKSGIVVTWVIILRCPKGNRTVCKSRC